METGTESHLKILEAQLFMNHITVNPSILLAHHHLLQTKNALIQQGKSQISYNIYGQQYTVDRQLSYWSKTKFSGLLYG